MTDLRTQTDEEIGAQTPTDFTAGHEPEHRTFRAATLDEAVAIARNELGVEVELIEAHRVRRGGLGGFFATDLGVEIIAAPRRPEPAATVASDLASSVVESSIPRTEGSALDRLIDRADAVDRLASVSVADPVDHAAAEQHEPTEPLPVFDELLRAELAEAFDNADAMEMLLPEDEHFAPMSTASVATPLVAPSDLFDAELVSADAEMAAADIAVETPNDIDVEPSADIDTGPAADLTVVTDDIIVAETVETPVEMMTETDVEFDVEFEYDIENLVAGYNEICFRDDDELMPHASMLVDDELAEMVAEVEELAEAAESDEADELDDVDEAADFDEAAELIEVEELAAPAEIDEVEAESVDVAETTQSEALALVAEPDEAADFDGVAELADVVAELAGVVAVLVADASAVVDQQSVGEELEVYGPSFRTLELDVVADDADEQMIGEELEVYGPFEFETLELDAVADDTVHAVLVGEELEVYGPFEFESLELDVVAAQALEADLDDPERDGEQQNDEELEVYGPFAVEPELAVDEDFDVDALLAFCYENDEDVQQAADDQLEAVADLAEIDVDPLFAMDAEMMYDALIAFDEQFSDDDEMLAFSDAGLDTDFDTGMNDDSDAEIDDAVDAFVADDDASTADLARPSDPIVMDRNAAIEELDALLRGVGVDPSTVSVGCTTQIVRPDEPISAPLQQVAAIATSQLIESVIALGEQVEQSVAKVSISVTNTDGSTVSISTDLAQSIDHG